MGVTKGMRLGRPNALAAAEIPPDAGSPSAGVEAGVAAVAVSETVSDFFTRGGILLYDMIRLIV